MNYLLRILEMSVTEGSATILVDCFKDERGSTSKDAPNAFYNNVQIVNRDLSVLAVQTYIDHFCSEKIRSRGIQVCEALGATGLRSIRYCHEIDGIKRIFCNDMSSEAIRIMKMNFKHNNVPEQKVVASCADANELMYRLARSKLEPLIYHAPKGSDKIDSKYDQLELPPQAESISVIDIDPYGSASPFLASAIACIEDGGLLCVTSTDSAVLCGKYPETCHAKYGSTSLRNCPFNHEMGLRILLAAIERAANLQGCYIVPLLSAKIDFYFRTFVIIRKKASHAKLSCAKLSNILQCTQCSHFQFIPVGVAGSANRRAKKNSEDGAPTEINLTKGEKALVAPDMPPISNFHVSTSRLSNDDIHCWDEVKSKFLSTSSLKDSREAPWCPSCDSENYTIGGPIYNQPIHSADFLTKCKQRLNSLKDRAELTNRMKLGAIDRVEALLTNLDQELPHIPLYYSIPRLCSDLGQSVPTTAAIFQGVRNLGFVCSRSHCNMYGIKTNCPSFVLYGLLKAIVQGNDGTDQSSVIEKSKLPHINCGALLLPLETVCPSNMKSGEMNKSVRYLPNPEPNWGPKCKR